MGAGYALLCTHIIGFIISQAILKKYFNVNFLNSFKHAILFYGEVYTIIMDRIKVWRTKA